MRRRELLGAAAVMVAAGCMEGGSEEDPDEWSGEVGDEDGDSSPDGAPKSEIKDAYRSALEDKEVPTEFISIGEVSGSIYVAHYVSEDTEEEIRRTIEAVTEVYAAGIEAGWDVTYLYAQMDDLDGEFLTAYTVEREWAENYVAGEITREKLTEMTLEEAHPPLFETETGMGSESES